MKTSAVETALASAKRFRPPDKDSYNEEITSTQRTVNHLRGLLDRVFLGVEKKAEDTIKWRLENTQECLKRLERERENLLKLKKISSIYPRLSLEPLKWRDGNKFPRLAIFSLDSPTFCLESRTYSVPDIVDPFLPIDIKNRYWDVLQLLSAKRQKKENTTGCRTTISLSCEFHGIIPDEIRIKIPGAKKLFGNNIFIIAEPKKFVLDETVSLPDGDPLIVGYDPNVDINAFWLIADFDTTPVEQAMIFHFEGDL
ncbi:MAG TPA: hypothetical protein VJH55_00425 [Candidatus Paceibacterota bacterium]